MTQHTNDTGKEFSNFLAEKPAGKFFDYDFKPNSSTGITKINVLGFLKGFPVDNLAISYVHALRPSQVQVIKPNEEEKTIGRAWRVKIRVNDAGLIDRIEQEVEVAFASGYTIDSELRRRGRRTS